MTRAVAQSKGWKRERRARCTECDGPILPGDIIEHEPPKGPWRHEDCDKALFLTRDPVGEE